MYPLIAIKDIVFETIAFHSRKVPSVGDFSYSIKWMMVVGCWACASNSFVALSKMYVPIRDGQVHHSGSK